MSEETKANEQNSKGKRSWLFRKITDDWIFGEVLVISAVFIIAYAVNFHGQGFSPKAEDWAYFATYLSGTVGVTAVVATLIVLVRTLGQQKALIKSQDDMLHEQRRQIDQVEKQNIAFEDSHRINLAYSSTKEISPVLIRSFKNWPSASIHPYIFSEPTIYQHFTSAFKNDERMVLRFLADPSLIFPMLLECPVKEAEDFVKRLFRPIENVYKFACGQIEIAPELAVYFEAEMMIGETRGRDNKYYFHCYQAFLIGREDEYFLKGVEFLGLDEDYSELPVPSLKLWQRIGELTNQR